MPRYWYMIGGALLAMVGSGGPALAGQPCSVAADCADINDDDIRDDGCLWWECVDHACVSTPVQFGDIGGAFGACTPDGVVDPNDRFHAINCFTNSALDASSGYPCETAAPRALSADAGGRNGDCNPDGVCDANDIYHIESILTGGTPCTCDTPAPDGEAATPGQARVFMALDGSQHDALSGSPMTIAITPGGTRRVMAWIEDTGLGGVLLNGYQLILPVAATPMAEARGSITYVDQNPGGGGGASLAIDEARSDWVFAQSGPLLPTAYTESPQWGLAGLFHATHIATGVDPVGDIHYLMEFDITASADAAGVFALTFIATAGSAPQPLSDLFLPTGGSYGVNEYQGLNIIVSDCVTPADCADTDDDGIRDDVCTLWTCIDNECVDTAAAYGDMGGSFGTCTPDGLADMHDHYHALNCFNNTDTFMQPGYPCSSAIQVDIGGPGGSCEPDGHCDGNDAILALDAFLETTPCTCGGPQPTLVDAGPTGEVHVFTRAHVDTVRPNDVIEVEVFVESPSTIPLRGYQLHVSATGGRRGHLRLVDMTATPRADHLFNQGFWKAFNVQRGQMVAGIMGPGAAPRAGAYLGSFAFKASADADGLFAIGVKATSTDRTFFFTSPLRAQLELHDHPTTVRVAARREPWTRMER